jgi:hypothetical protein
MGSLPARTYTPKVTGVRKMIPASAIVAALVASTCSARSEPSKPTAPASRHMATLCAANELVLASCSIRTKLVSVCGRNRKATYRFGRPWRIELKTKNLHYAHQVFAGGGESQVVAISGAYRYVIYDRSIRSGIDIEGHSPLQFTSGLMVQRNGRYLANMICSPMNADIIDTSSVPNFMPKGEYIWHKGVGTQ